MTNAEIILETAKWIEERLGDELPVPAVAAKSGYSLHHFTRLFVGVAGIAPKEYILRRKLSEAGLALAGRRCRVTDAAFEFGFRDLETFSRAFSREFGVSPSSVRAGASFPYLAPLAMTLCQAPTIVRAPVIERFPAVLLAGRSIRVIEAGDSVGKLWAAFMPRSASIPRRRVPPAFRQLATWDDADEDSLDILVGVEMETLDELPLDLVGKAVPACDCLVFEHRGAASRIAESYGTIYADLLPAMDRRPTLAFNFERYLPDAGDPWSDVYRFDICVPLA
jgi:AraC family transcriptional regulator